MSDDQQIAISLEINGEPLSVAAGVRQTVADIVRGQGLLGTKLGCEQGICGACTVLVDGAPVRSCLLFAWQADGARVTTVEGEGPSGLVTRAREAVARRQAFQCGYCTAGFITLIAGFLNQHPNASDAELEEALCSNICRCTGYRDLLAAARDVRDELESV